MASTAVGIVFAMPAVTAGGNWKNPLLNSLAQWWAWCLLVPLIIAVDLRLPISSTQMRLRLLAHVPLGLAFTAACVYVTAAMRAALGLTTWGSVLNPGLLQYSLQGFFLWSWLIYWLIAGAWLVRQYYERYRSSELRAAQMERLFSEARLNALRMQLDPHFLFNALNTISSQVESNPRLARRMIENLGDLLRLSLASKDKQEVPLVEELQFLEHYLAIQRIRFGDRLKLETSISDEARYALVPCLIVQPLVENAIRHGVSQRAAGGTVTVAAQRDNGFLRIEVRDDGVGLPPGWSLSSSQGLGLSVTRQRIAGLHPEPTSRFDVRRRPGGGTEVEICLPFRAMGEQG